MTNFRVHLILFIFKSVQLRQIIFHVTFVYTKNTYKLNRMLSALKWLLITSLTGVSGTLLMFVSAFIAVFPETARYYNVSVPEVILLSNTFNIFYLIITPLIFPWLKKHYTKIVQIAVFMVAVGCVGRAVSGNQYNSALFWSIVVAISHIPIITAPYGLLALFEPEKRGYAASIPLFASALGINFSILYGYKYIAMDSKIDLEQISPYIQTLNLIIAICAVVFSSVTLILMNILKRQIRQINDDSDDVKNQKSCLRSLKADFSNFRKFIVLALSWGTILGANWTYGGMFGVLLTGTGLSHKDIAMVGLVANLTSAIFSNLGNWIANNTRFKNISIIFFLNIIGFLGSIFIQGSSIFAQPIFHDKFALMLAIILIRAGFSSFISLCLNELGQYGPSVLVSSVFFYIANASNLSGIYLAEILSHSQSLALLSIVIWLCIFIVHISYKTSTSQGVIQLEEDDSTSNGKRSEQELDDKNKKYEASIEDEIKV